MIENYGEDVKSAAAPVFSRSSTMNKNGKLYIFFDILVRNFKKFVVVAAQNTAYSH